MTTISQDLIGRLKAYGLELGVDKMTFADLTRDGLLLRDENRRFLLDSGFHRAISLAKRLSETACGLVFHQDDQGLMHYFKAHCLSQAGVLDQAAQQMALFLEENGYRAFVVPGLGTGYTDGAPGILSHMAVANVSGMGSMADNGMIVTPEYGPRVRLATIVTDCPLPPGSPVQDQCTHCRLCREACPSAAIAGGRFDPGQPSVQYIDRLACEKYRDKRLAETGNRFCNLCMSVCPIGVKLQRAGQ